jgi:hypothetical protein
MGEDILVSMVLLALFFAIWPPNLSACQDVQKPGWCSNLEHYQKRA